jgi:hypothetical protein
MLGTYRAVGTHFDAVAMSEAVAVGYGPRDVLGLPGPYPERLYGR